MSVRFLTSIILGFSLVACGKSESASDADINAQIERAEIQRYLDRHHCVLTGTGKAYQIISDKYSRPIPDEKLIMGMTDEEKIEFFEKELALMDQESEELEKELERTKNFCAKKYAAPGNYL